MNSKTTSDTIGPFIVGDIVFNHTTMTYEIAVSMDNEQQYFTIRPLRWYDRLHIKAKIIWPYLRKKVMQMNSKVIKWNVDMNKIIFRVMSDLVINGDSKRGKGGKKGGKWK